MNHQEANAKAEELNNDLSRCECQNCGRNELIWEAYPAQGDTWIVGAVCDDCDS